MEEPTKRGGAGRGQGRKKSPSKKTETSFTVRPDHLEKLAAAAEKMAARSGKPAKKSAALEFIFDYFDWSLFDL